MFILLKHTDTYKGILIVTHIEKKFIKKIVSKIGDKYNIYGHWCNGHPSHLKTKLATYFTDSVFYKNRVNRENTDKVKILLKKMNIEIDGIEGDKIFDFINVGRVGGYKNTNKIFEIMKIASEKYKKKSLLVLIEDIGNDKNLQYLNNIIDKHHKLPENVRKNIFLYKPKNNDNSQYCIEKSLTYDELSLLFNYSKIYIHAREGFDEARIIGQAVLSGCLLLCNKKLNGHSELRKKCKDSVVEFNNKNISEKIEEILLKEKTYVFNPIINNLYNEEITIINELNRYYKECKYKIEQEEFIKLCDKKLWSLKVAGHYSDVYWSKKLNNLKYSNPTNHIQSEEQLELFFDFIKKIL